VFREAAAHARIALVSTPSAIAMAGYEYSQWQYNPHLTSDGSYQPQHPDQRSATNAENYSLNMQNPPFSLPGLDLANAPASYATQDADKAHSAESDDDLEFYGTSSKQPDIPTRSTYDTNQNRHSYYDGPAECGPGNTSQGPYFNGEVMRRGASEGQNGYFSSGETPASEPPPVVQLPGLGSFSEPVPNGRPGNTEGKFHGATFLASKADRIILGAMLMYLGCLDRDQPSVSNVLPSPTTANLSETQNLSRLAPDQLIAQLLTTTQGQSNSSQAAAFVSKPNGSNSLPNGGPDAAPTRADGPNSTASIQPYGTLHRLALATIKNLHQAGFSFNDLVALGPLDKAEESQLTEMYREAGLLPENMTRSKDVRSQRHNVGPSPEKTRWSAGSVPMQRKDEAVLPQPEAPTQLAAVPQPTTNLIPAPQTLTATRAIQQEQAAPAPSESIPQTQGGREAYLARLQAIRGSKKPSATKDEQSASNLAEATKPSTESPRVQPQDGGKEAEKSSNALTPTIPQAPIQVQTLAPTQTQPPAQPAYHVQARAPSEARANAPSAPATVEPEKPKSLPANEKIQARIIYLKANLAKNKQLATATNGHTISPSPADRQSSTSSFGSLYSAQQPADGGQPAGENSTAAPGKPHFAAPPPTQAVELPGLAAAVSTTSQLPIQYEPMGPHPPPVERPNPTTPGLSTVSRPTSRGASYPIYNRRFPANNFAQGYPTYGNNRTPTLQSEDSVFELYVSDKESGDEMDIDDNANEDAPRGPQEDTAALIMPAPQHPAQQHSSLLGGSTHSPNNMSAPGSASHTPTIQAKNRLARMQAKLAEKLAAERKALAEAQEKQKAALEASSTPAQPPEQTAYPTTSVLVPNEYSDASTKQKTKLATSGTGGQPTILPSSDASELGTAATIRKLPTNGTTTILPTALQPSASTSELGAALSSETSDAGACLPVAPAGSMTKTPLPAHVEPSTSSAIGALNKTRAQTPTPSKKRSAGSPGKTQDESRKKRRAETESGLSEVNQTLSEKMRQLEEHRQMMAKLQAEIVAQSRKREELAKELEEVGIDTDGMTHEEMIKTKETLDATQEIEQQVSSDPKAIPHVADSIISIAPVMCSSAHEPESTVESTSQADITTPLPESSEIVERTAVSKNLDSFKKVTNKPDEGDITLSANNQMPIIGDGSAALAPTVPPMVQQGMIEQLVSTRRGSPEYLATALPGPSL
jgi:hypothetical protein